MSLEPLPAPRHCCAKCKTPYNCGNVFCPCHHGQLQAPENGLRLTDADMARIRAEAFLHPEFFIIDLRRAARNPNIEDHGQGLPEVPRRRRHD